MLGRRRAPAFSTMSSAPSRSKTFSVSGLVYSPHALSRGKAARSRSSTRKLRFARCAEREDPAGPAPTMMASYALIRVGYPHSRTIPEACNPKPEQRSGIGHQGGGANRALTALWLVPAVFSQRLPFARMGGCGRRGGHSVGRSFGAPRPEYRRAARMRDRRAWSGDWLW